MRNALRVIPFFMISAHLAFAVQIQNNTSKTLRLKLSENAVIEITGQTTLNIPDEQMSELRITANGTASIYHLKNESSEENRLFDIVEDKEVNIGFNISVSDGPRQIHRELHNYKRITITTYDPDKPDDALLLILEKKAEVLRRDEHDPKNIKCSIL